MTGCVDVPYALAGICEARGSRSCPVVPTNCSEALDFFEMQRVLFGVQYSSADACADTTAGFAAFILQQMQSIGFGSGWQVPPGYTSESGMNEICAASCDRICKDTATCTSTCGAPLPPSLPSPPTPPPLFTPLAPPSSPPPLPFSPPLLVGSGQAADAELQICSLPLEPGRNGTRGVDWPCDNGFQCVPLDIENPDTSTAVCIPCLKGQSCRRTLFFDTTDNLEASLAPTAEKPRLCLPGYRCRTPSELESCPAGTYCGFTFPGIGDSGEIAIGGVFEGQCPDGFRDPWMDWKQALYCAPESSVGTNGLVDFICPNGHYCPNSSSLLACEAGFFCPQGSSSMTSCEAGLLDSREVRCPKGSSFEPAWPQYAAYLAAGVVPLLLILEVWSRVEISRRRREGGDSTSLGRSTSLEHGGDSCREGSSSVSSVTSCEPGASAAVKRLPRNDRRKMPRDLQSDTTRWVIARQMANAGRAVRRASLMGGRLVGKSAPLSEGSACSSPPKIPPLSLPKEAPNPATTPAGATSNNLFVQALEAGLGTSVQLKGRTLTKLELSGLDFHIGKAQVLTNVNTILQQGELVALMGESGSGKTTLLNVLGGRANYGSISGEMKLNNRPFEPQTFLHLLGYVPQAHLVYKELTVYENLAYAAKLRLHRGVTAKERAQLVEISLELLGLQQCRHFVCDPSIGQRLSGGQMRRVGIGIELVCDPPIMLLDEPTSALDAVNTRLVVAALKNLTRRGVLVCASLHQPRHAVYEMIDRLLLLRKGELIYGGLRSESLRYFKQLGFSLVGANPADFFIEVAFGFEFSDKKHCELPAHFGLRPSTRVLVGHLPAGMTKRKVWRHFQGLGLRWERMDPDQQVLGKELDNEALRGALASGRTEFDEEEWEKFGVELPPDSMELSRSGHFVQVGSTFFRPAYSIGQVVYVDFLNQEQAVITYYDKRGSDAAIAKLHRTFFGDSRISVREHAKTSSQGQTFEVPDAQRTTEGGWRLTWDSEVRADSLGLLWRNFFKVASSSVALFMDQIARGQSDDRRRAISVLQYARRVAKANRKKSRRSCARTRSEFGTNIGADNPDQPPGPQPTSPNDRGRSRKNTWQGPKISIPGAKRLSTNLEALISLPASPRSGSSKGDVATPRLSVTPEMAAKQPSMSDSTTSLEGVDERMPWTADRADEAEPLGVAEVAVEVPPPSSRATSLSSRLDETDPSTARKLATEMDAVTMRHFPTPLSSPRATFSGELDLVIPPSAPQGPPSPTPSPPEIEALAVKLEKSADAKMGKGTDQCRDAEAKEHVPRGSATSSDGGRRRSSSTPEAITAPALRRSHSDYVPERTPSVPMVSPRSTALTNSGSNLFSSRSTIHSSGPRQSFAVKPLAALGGSIRTLTFRGAGGASPPLDSPRSRKSSSGSRLGGSNPCTPRSSGRDTTRSSIRVEEDFVRAEEHLRDKFTKLGVTLEDFTAWFTSDEAYGQSMEEDLAKELWHKAAAMAALTAQENPKRWAINAAKILAPLTSLGGSALLAPDGAAERDELLPSWTQLRSVIYAWPMPRGQQPGWRTHFYVCMVRYTYKTLRKRLRIYFLLLVTALLGCLCGALHGSNPDRNDLLIFFLLFNTMYGSIAATSSIATFGEDVQFFCHEAASGVSQTAEGLARLLIDILPLAALAPAFTLPLKALATVRSTVLLTWLLFGWALSPLGYIFTLLAPANATVLTSSATFVLCAFMNGYFGIKLASVPESVRWIVEWSPGYASFFLLSFGSAVDMPFSTTRWSLTKFLQFAEMLPRHHAPEGYLVLEDWERDIHPWRRNNLIKLALFGLVLRLLTLFFFVKRSSNSTLVSRVKKSCKQQLQCCLCGCRRTPVQTQMDATVNMLDRLGPEASSSTSESTLPRRPRVKLGGNDNDCKQSPPTPLKSPPKTRKGRITFQSGGASRRGSAGKMRATPSIANGPTGVPPGDSPPSPPRQSPSPAVQISLPAGLALGQESSAPDDVVSSTGSRATMTSRTSLSRASSSASSWWMTTVGRVSRPSMRSRPRAASEPTKTMRRSGHTPKPRSESCIRSPDHSGLRERSDSGRVCSGAI